MEGPCAGTGPSIDSAASGPPTTTAPAVPRHPAAPGDPIYRVFFIFIFFENIFYKNIFSISQFTVLYPYRPAGGRQGLICKLKKIYLRGSPWREPAAPLPGGRPLPPIHWAAGGLPPGRGGGRLPIKWAIRCGFRYFG